MNRRRILAALLIMAALSFVGTPVSIATANTGDSDSRDDFAVFDRAYIPALALTKMGTADTCRNAMDRLKTQWQVLLSKHYNTMPDDPKWKSDFDHVGRAIAKADELVASANLPAAHEALEEIREIFLGARRRHGADYYLDKLTDFHATMERIVISVSVDNPGKLADETVVQLRGLAAKAEQEWSRVQEAPCDRRRFGLDEKKLAQLQDLLSAEAKALGRLRKSLETGSKPEIISSGKAIKPIFAKTFMLFGDFPKPPKGRSKNK